MIVAPVWAQTVDPGSDLGRFRALRTETAQGLTVNDWPRAEAAADEVRAILPSSGAILLLAAQAKMGAGKIDAAKANLKALLDRGSERRQTRPDFTP